ncbi:hypothetical protein HAX54_014345 [Datura stramonium]|uniref:Thionin-like protein n=1 Tax=Datura stramonium TaxID=4076 RepID=A0ABS8RYZ3_DATST|nr:hypothetical protein [Datura stramonium]
MERISRIIVWVLIMLIVVGKQMYVVNGDSPYACWGGCYNQCMILNSKASSSVPAAGREPCYVQCLNKCVPRSTAEYQNYCNIGCSLELCVPTRFNAGADLDACFGNCGNICRG